MEGLIINLIRLWVTGNIFDKIYVVFCIIMAIVMILSIRTFFTKGAKKKLDFVLKAQEAGCCVSGKMTCLTREGTQKSNYYSAEYMYVVNDKRYFVTYKINPKDGNEEAEKESNGDLLALDIQKYPMFFYDAKNPAKVLCKADVFTSMEAFDQIDTAKDNIYRDVEKDWNEPINLVR